eukprot:1038023-Pyramimonas_sp.AAC.1
MAWYRRSLCANNSTPDGTIFIHFQTSREPLMMGWSPERSHKAPAAMHRILPKSAMSSWASWGLVRRYG